MQRSSFLSIAAEAAYPRVVRCPRSAMCVYAVRHAAALEIRLFPDAVQAAEFPTALPTQNGNYLLRREHIVFALDSLTVGVLTAVKAALFVRQLTQDVVRGASCDVGILGIACCLIRADIGY